MPDSCAYPGCFNIMKPKRKRLSGQKNLTFHRFPLLNPERLKLWLIALHLDINTQVLINKRVCSDHFSDNDFKPSRSGDRRFLKASAVPMFLQKTETPSCGSLESLAKHNSAELEVREAGAFSYVPQPTALKQRDFDPGTTTSPFVDAPSQLRLLLASPESAGKRKTPSSSGIYFAHPATHSYQPPPVCNQPELKEEPLEESLELDVSVRSIDPPSEKKDVSFQPLSSTSTSTTSKEEEEEKWIAKEPSVMERVCSDRSSDNDFKPSQPRARQFLKAPTVPIFLQKTKTSCGSLESLAKHNSAGLEVREAGAFLAYVPQPTAVNQRSNPGTTATLFVDVPSQLYLLLASPESAGKRKTPSSSWIYFANPATHFHQSPPVCNQPELKEPQERLELDVRLRSKDPPSEKKDVSFQPPTSTSTSTTKKEEEECEIHWKPKKWISNEPSVMELFKRCQECGSVITKTTTATVGSVLCVHWECEKKHKGKWSGKAS